MENLKKKLKCIQINNKSKKIPQWLWESACGKGGLLGLREFVLTDRPPEIPAGHKKLSVLGTGRKKLSILVIFNQNIDL